MSLVRFTLTAPADKAIFDRISAAYANFEAWTTALREKKIDVQHEIIMWTRLQRDEKLGATLDAQPLPEGAEHGRVERQLRLRADRIYFRALLLNLLDVEDAWQRDQDAKAAAKAGKV